MAKLWLRETSKLNLDASPLKATLNVFYVLNHIWSRLKNSAQYIFVVDTQIHKPTPLHTWTLIMTTLTWKQLWKYFTNTYLAFTEMVHAQFVHSVNCIFYLCWSFPYICPACHTHLLFIL